MSHSHEHRKTHNLFENIKILMFLLTKFYFDEIKIDRNLILQKKVSKLIKNSSKNQQFACF